MFYYYLKVELESLHVRSTLLKEEKHRRGRGLEGDGGRIHAQRYEGEGFEGGE